jgi:hypothetical protein
VSLHLLTIDPAPLAIDPRPCEGCALTIDRHVMVDHGEGPEHFCPDLSPDEMTLPELERRAELRRLEDIAAILAGWIEPVDAPSIVPAAREPSPYRTAASTVDAFRYVAAGGDAARLRDWLTARPKDAPYLLSLLESKTAC